MTFDSLDRFSFLIQIGNILQRSLTPSTVRNAERELTVWRGLLSWPIDLQHGLIGGHLEVTWCCVGE